MGSTSVAAHGGNFLTHRGVLCILALPVRGRGGAVTAVMAVGIDQRNEALREFLAHSQSGTVSPWC